MTSLEEKAACAAQIYRSTYKRDPHAIMINFEQWQSVRPHLEPIVSPATSREIRKLAGFTVLLCCGIAGPVAVSSPFAEKLIDTGHAWLAS